MAVVEESIVIPRPPQEVFEYVVDVEHLPDWDGSTIEAGWEDPSNRGVGSRAWGVTKVLGRRFRWVTECTELDAPRALRYRSVEGPFRYTITQLFEPEDDGGSTRFTWRVDADPGLGGFFGKLADPLVVRAEARNARNNLETLAEILTEHRDVA